MSHHLNKKDCVSDEHVEKLLNVFSRIRRTSVWATVQKEDFDVKLFETGYLTDICACILTETAIARLKPSSNDPTGIVVKLFPKTFFYPVNPIHRCAIYTSISENGLGPRLLYIDDECCVNEYIQHARHSNDDDDKNTEFLEQVIRSLARYHSLQVPIPDSFPQAWYSVIDALTTDFPGVKEILDGSFLRFLDENVELKDYREVFSTLDIRGSFEYFKKALKALDCPTVLSHMDFHRLNRLFRESRDPQTGDTTQRMYFLDLDATLYSYRGFDLGAFFVNFLQSHALFDADPFPTDEQIVPLIEIYRYETSKVLGDNGYLSKEINSVATILREIKVFGLYYYFISFFFPCTVFCCSPSDSKNIESIHISHKRLLSMNKFREVLEKANILPQV